MLALLLLAGLTICPRPCGALAVSDRDIQSVKPQHAAKPLSYFETTDVYKVWFLSESLPIFAQAGKDPLGLNPEDRKRYDEHMRAGDRSLIIGYVCVGLGILILIVGVAMTIYRDRMR